MSWFNKYLPKEEILRKHPSLKFLHEHMQDPRLWHFTRGSTARGVWIGLFMACMPIPFQMIPSAILAILFRANLILSVALVWLSNPITMVPLMYAFYLLGCKLLAIPVLFDQAELTLDFICQNLGQIFWPLAFGSVIIGLTAGFIGFLLVRFTWPLIAHWFQAHRDDH